MPHELPTRKGTHLFPNQIGPSLNVRYIGPNAGSEAAVAAVASVQGAINHFVRAQRLHVSSGITNIHKRRASVGGVDLEYQNQFGYETLTINPHVELETGYEREEKEDKKTNTQTDFMLDGYITVYANISSTDTIIGEDVYFNILLNGTFVGKIGYSYGGFTPVITEVDHWWILNGRAYANNVGGGVEIIYTG